MRGSLEFGIASLAMMMLCAPIGAQEETVASIATVKVTEGIYMLQGEGGNIGLAVGPDATFLIDDQYAPVTEAILEAVAEVTDRSIDFVLNTHWHGDHTGRSRGRR